MGSQPKGAAPPLSPGGQLSHALSCCHPPSAPPPGCRPQASARPWRILNDTAADSAPIVDSSEAAAHSAAEETRSPEVGNPGARNPEADNLAPAHTRAAA